MKIVINTDQNYMHGGIEKVTATKVNYWVNQPDTEVFIVTSEQQGNAPCYSMDKRVHLIDLSVNYNRQQSYFSPENLKKAIKHFKKQTQLFREIQPDVIISPNFNWDFYWFPFIHRKSRKIKEIHSSRYSWEPTIKNRINAWFEKRYDAVVVLNKDEANYFNAKNIFVIPNPVEKSVFSALLESKKVIAAGRISPVKGFDQLITAWKIVHSRFPDWQLHFYGQDYLNTQEKLEKQIIELELQDVVFFKGSVNNMDETMSQYSIYAMSSISECFPMVLLEAMSVGLPIVSYDCPHGPGNIITHGIDGFLAENQNPNSLAEELIKVIGDNILRKEMGSNAKQNSIRFNTENIMQKWLSLLLEK